MAANLDKLVEEIDKMSVSELNSLVKKIEEKFGVSAAAMAVAAPAAGGADEGAAKEEQTEFTIILKSVDPTSKIAAIKVVREATGLGLGEAKALVDNAPSTIKEGVSKEVCDELKAKFTEAKAVIELK